MRRLLSLLLVLSISTSWSAPSEPFPLWKGKAPGATGETEKDIPTLTPFFPEEGKVTGAAIVILPGGGYGGLAGHEGAGYAEWLTKQGITCFVLKYRLGSAGYRHPIMLQDAARAIRTVRSRAAEWKIDPTRIGVMGSSAGGHLASTILTHFDGGMPNAGDEIDKTSSRPDLGILCYPVITMGPATHGGSKQNLLGDSPSKELVELLSNEKQVTAQTPPTFIFHTAEDKAVPVENALLFADALRKSNVPFDLHIYQKGAHGIGLGKGHADGDLHPWTNDLRYWLEEQGFLKK